MDDLAAVPADRQAGPAGLGGRRTPLGHLPLHRPAPGRAARDVDRDHRPAHHHRVDPAGPVDRVRIRGPQLVADGLPAGDHRDPRPPRLPLRRRGDAPGDLRVPGPPLTVGPPPDTDELAEQAVRFWTRVTPDVPFMGFATGRFIEVATKLGIPLEEAGLTGLKAPPGFGLGRGGHAPHDRGRRVLRLRRRPVRPVARGPHPRGLGGGPGGRPATGREVADGEWGNLTVTTLDRDNGLLRYDLEEACAMLREPCPCGETSIRGLWGGRFKPTSSGARAPASS